MELFAASCDRGTATDMIVEYPTTYLLRTTTRPGIHYATAKQST